MATHFTGDRLTAFKILLYCDLSIVISTELVLPCVDVGCLFHRLRVPEVRSLDANSLYESRVSRTEACIIELLHADGEVARRVKCRRAYVDVHHKLLVGRAHRRIEAAPGLEATTKRRGRVSRRRVEEPVFADHHAATAWPVRVRGEDEIERGDHREDVVSAVLPLAIKVTFTSESAHPPWSDTKEMKMRKRGTSQTLRLQVYWRVF